jgi:hypothetical protein
LWDNKKPTVSRGKGKAKGKRVLITMLF